MTLAPSLAKSPIAVEPPYVGLTHFTEDYADRFFGRETECGVIVGNLSASRLTLLYAESGVGKSSLLRAGVAARIHQHALSEMASGRPPRFVAAVFSTWTDDPVVGIVDALSGALEPFIDEPVELPPNLEAAIETATELVDTTLLLILDQFEEYFLYHRQEDGGEPLADQLARCLKRPDLRANFLISIREDMYASLGDLFRGRIANVYGNFLHLDYLDREGAREAIVRPIEGLRETVPGIDIEAELVEAVLDGVRLDPARQATDGRPVAAVEGDGKPTTERSETAYLQLVMRRLWDEEAEAGSAVLRLETLRRLGGTQEIIEGHLNRAMGELRPDQQDTAASAFRFLVTRAGTKIAWTPKDLSEVADVTEPELDPVLQRLAARDLKILRPVSLPDGDTESYEIFHDALARPIVRWREDHAVERERVAKEEAQRQAAEATESEARERRRKRIAVIALAVVVAALLAIAAALAFVERSRSDERLRAAQSVVIAGRINEVSDSFDFGPYAAALASAEALRLWPTFEARSTAIARLQENAGMPRVLLGHSRSVVGLAYAPAPSGRLASASTDGTVRIWRADGTPITTLRVPDASPTSVAFEPNGEDLVIGRSDGGVDLWSADSQDWSPLLKPTECYYSPCTPVAFSPDGSTVAAGGDDGVRLWDLRRPSSAPQFVSDSAVHALGYSLDGGQFAAAGDYGVTTWEIAPTGRIAKRTEVQRSYVTSYALAWGPDGRLAAGTSSSGVSVWSADGAEQSFAAPARVNAVGFLDDGALVAYGGDDQNVTVRDVETGRHVGSPRFHANWVNALAVDHEGRTIAAGSEDGVVKLWPADASGALASVTLGVEGNSHVAVGREGIAAAASNQESPVYVWSPSSGELSPSASSTTIEDYAAPLEMSGSTVAATSSDDWMSFALWNVGDSCGAMPQSACLLGSSPPTDSINAMDLNPSATLVATGSSEGSLAVWDASDPARIRLEAEGKASERINAVAFSPFGDGVLATASEDGEVVLWRYQDGQLRELATRKMGDAAYALAFSPTRRLLAAGGAGQSVALWDIGDPRRPVTASWPVSQTDSILALAFSSDGRILVAGDGDGGACPYDVETLRLLGSSWCLIGSAFGEENAIDALAFDPTAGTLLTTGRGQPVIAWDGVLWGGAEDAVIESAVCRFAPRELTAAEWKYAFADTKLEGDQHPTCAK